ncbi:MAG: protease complex subunit PrcB family protein [Gemmataceae bacterium]|nr:protease complex subunit PrcB family protein [Gemmataceae bacterium]
MRTLVFAAGCFFFLQAGNPNPPAKLELFSKEPWYKAQEGKETSFVGVLKKAAPPKGFGFGRYVPYHLALEGNAQPSVRGVYVGNAKNILDPYVGKRVRLIGKSVEFRKLEGKDHFEVWPARLELVAQDDDKGKPKDKDDKDKKDKGKNLKILGQGSWPYGPKAGPNRTEQQKLVLRSVDELIAATPFKDLDAPQPVVEKAAVEALVKILKVDGINWKTHMLIVVTAGSKPTGGWKVVVDSVHIEGKKATVHWHAQPPEGNVTQAFTHPGVVALIERFEGKVDFVSKK